ncbi:MAG: GH116 family glycosyl hydrolase [Acidobacteriota bacterium]
MAKRTAISAVFLLSACAISVLAAGQVTAPAGTIPRFEIGATDINLSRPARPSAYFDKVGRRFAVLGFESGAFEAWAYPLKILRNFSFSFLIGSSTVPLEGKDIVRFISVDPAVTTLVFTYQSFTVRAHFVASIHEPGAVILLEVDSSEPLTIVCGFLPVLQPMWPAGIGGQYAYWDAELKAYLISEPTRKNHGYVGCPAAQGISYTPAHMLSDAPNQFKIVVADPGAASGVYFPLILAGGKGKRDEVRAVYRKLAADPGACWREAAAYYAALRQSTLRVRTGRRELDLAFEWAKVALDNLRVDNPDLGRGLVAGLGPSGTGGRPGFGWFFGTDAYLNSLSFNSMGNLSAAREALAFTQKWQRPDGKMAHELSQAAGYVRWWEDYPYGYIHGDTTPYYIVAMEDYVRRSGDLEFLRASWPSLVRAYNWCLTTDVDGDGLMDNAKAGLGALEFGALTGIQTDIYLAAVWARANRAMADLAAQAKDSAISKTAEKNAAAAVAALDAKFWDAEGRRYSYAFAKDGRLVRELTPWSAVALAWGLGSRERGLETLAAVNAADLTMDWGVRMLSKRSPLFEPLNYNYGAAWPFLTGWVSSALFEYGFIPQGFEVLMGNVRHTFDNGLGVIIELFSGYQNSWPQEGVPHQGFSTTGVVLPFVRGFLGLETDALRGTIAFEPKVPAGFPEIAVENMRVGDKVVSLSYAREIRVAGGKASRVRLRVRSDGNLPPGLRMKFAPGLGPGTKILSASLNGAPLPVKTEGRPSDQSVRPRLEFSLTGDDTVEIAVEPAPEIIPPDNASMTGDLDRGLKIVRTDFAGGELKIVAEGLAGETYALEIANGDLVGSVTGAAYDGRRLAIAIPGGKTGEFARQTVILRPKN